MTDNAGVVRMDRTAFRIISREDKGFNRTTGDLNIFVNPTEENYKRLLIAFQIFGMSVFDMNLKSFLDTNNFDVFEFGRPPVAIDIMTKLKGVDFDLAF